LLYLPSIVPPFKVPGVGSCPSIAPDVGELPRPPPLQHRPPFYASGGTVVKRLNESSAASRMQRNRELGRQVQRAADVGIRVVARADVRMQGKPRCVVNFIVQW